MSLPYFKCHPPDYLNRYEYNSLSCEEFGATMRVLLLMWQAGMRLQDDDLYIARQINIEPQQWARVKMKLVDLGVLFNDQGKLGNTDIKTKFHQAEKFCEQQREKRQKRKKTA